MNHPNQPEGECQCTSLRCQHRVGNARNEVAQILLRASQPDVNDSRNRFIPLNQLKSAFPPDKVRNLLRVFGCDEACSLSIYEIADQIRPPEGLCQCCKDDLCTGRIILFVTLVLLAKEKHIVDFHRSSPQICDSTKLSRQNKADELQIENNEVAFETDDSLMVALSTIMQEWRSQDKDLFYHLQWQMKSPYFQTWDSSSEGYRQLDEEVSLPWIEAKTLQQVIDLQISTVQRIRIHQAHHCLGGDQDFFALKVLDTSVFPGIAEESFKNETTARVSHPHITALLAAFQYRNKFYLILPWAEEGNLRQLWKDNPDSPQSPSGPVTWYSDSWLVDQCFGIVDALAKVHGYVSLLQEEECFHPPKLHHDIKPENILCFRSCGNTAAPCVLKLTDFEFSLALGPSRTIKVEKTIGSKTYRPPEAEFKKSKIGHSWDIWCLGCLYLEFITWAILGWPGVEHFGDSRAEEEDDRIGKSELRPVQEDVFFRKRAVKSLWTWFNKSKPKFAAEIKQTVALHIKGLRNNLKRKVFLEEFLDYIEKNMLVIDSSKRATSGEVRDYMHRLMVSLAETTHESRQPRKHDAA